ncbi:MAG: RNase adapter RapZ [Turicibacter sp.]|nr:RNase adapter RapZ [Turicibacter sp.]
MQFVIVTGMSGAGISTLLNIFEDLGYYCVDNLPPSLIQNLADFCLEGGAGIDKVALGIDIRGIKRFDDFFTGLAALKQRHLAYSIIFLESTDEILLKRFKETRRLHPIGSVSIAKDIAEERELLKPIKAHASYVFDTSLLLVRQLREMVLDIFMGQKEFGFIVHICSFGFKYGLPMLADLVFDVRCLPNPFYVEELKQQTGLDASVQNFIMQSEVSQDFLRHIGDMLLFLVPLNIKEGKNQMVVAIGCTGGKHRSVTMAVNTLNILQKSGYSAVIDHRDINN